MEKLPAPRCSACEDCFEQTGPARMAKRICGKAGQKLNRRSRTSPMWCPKRREQPLKHIRRSSIFAVCIGAALLIASDGEILGLIGAIALIVTGTVCCIESKA